MNFYIVLIFVALIVIAPFYKEAKKIYWSRKIKQRLDGLFNDRTSGS